MEANASRVAHEADRPGVSEPSGLPRSVTVMAINLAGIVGVVAALAAIHAHGARLDDVGATLVTVGSFALPVIVLEALFLKTWRRPSTGFDFSRPGAFRWKRPVLKLIGFYATLGLGLGVYALFPEYQGGFYFSYYQMLRRVLPVVAALAVPYFLLLDRYDQRPEDGYWQVSLALRGRFRKVNRAVLGQHLLGWLVKAYYLPLMFKYCTDGVSRLRYFDPHSLFNLQALSFDFFYDFTYDTLFNIDVLVAVAGYMLTVRLLDSHVRSAEPSLLGWVAALACYEPFWSLMEGQYLAYGRGGMGWRSVFGRSPVLYQVWGSVILILVLVYLAATISFGIRFSNLTSRGILTNGPYRLTKHPAYVSKNLSWWLISLPFLTTGSWRDALRHSVMLLCVNTIYFLRARTEERHLSRDPAYVAYATAMERKGLLRWVGRLVPVLKYKPGRMFNL